MISLIAARLRARTWMLALATLASVGISTPASAEYYTQSLRMAGTWTTPHGRLVIKIDSFEGTLVGEYNERGKGLKYKMWWADSHTKMANEDVGRGIDMVLMSNESSDNFKCQLFQYACQAGRVLFKVSRDGRILHAEHLSGERIEPESRWMATRLADPSQAGEPSTEWVGDWDTSEGKLSFQVQGDLLVGTYQKSGVPGAAGEGTIALSSRYIHNGKASNSVSGVWDLENSFPRQRGRIELEFAEDGQSFTAKVSRSGSSSSSFPKPIVWTGKRRQAAEPQPQETPPGPTGEGSPPQPGTDSPSQAEGFKSLNRFDVRLDRLWEARGYPTRQVHAFVTVRNSSAQPQYVTSGLIKAVLTDTDGVAQERNQVWRASFEPAALFNATPVVQPGAELKVRYVFNPDEGSQPASLALSEGGKRVEFAQ